VWPGMRQPTTRLQLRQGCCTKLGGRERELAASCCCTCACLAVLPLTLAAMLQAPVLDGAACGIGVHSCHPRHLHLWPGLPHLCCVSKLAFLHSVSSYTKEFVMLQCRWWLSKNIARLRDAKFEAM
jgi:hypothetical protein